MTRTPHQSTTTSIIRNVVFDLGGVLLNWEPAQIARSFATETANPQLQQRVLEQVFRHTDWQRLDQGLLSEPEAVHQFAINCDVNTAEIRRLMALVRKSLTTKADTVAIMNNLKRNGYRIFCLSNICREIYHDLQSRHAFFAEFEDVIVSAEVGMVKPQTAIFDYMLQRFDIEASHTLFIDDMDANVGTARECGIQAIRFTNANDCKQAIAQVLGYTA